MLGMLKSEIYKLFKKKSFYICALVLMGLAGIAVWTYESMLTSRFGITESGFLKQLGYTGWNGIQLGLGNVLLMNSIFTSIFVCYEFSSGMNKNLAIRGKNKFVMYFSKMIVSMLIPVLYTLLAALTSYAIGSHLWGAGKWEQDYVNSIIIPLGLFVLVQMVYQSIFVMAGYLSKSSGWTTAINFAISSLILPLLAIKGINYILDTWFGVKESVAKYWPGDGFVNIYEYKYPLDVEHAKIFPWVLIAYFVIPAIIGSVVFYRREVK